MSSTTTETTTIEKAPVFDKKLEGVHVTDALLQIWKECCLQANSGGTKSGSSAAGQLSKKEAIQVLKESPQHPNNNPQWIPLNVLKAMEVLVKDSSSLERALDGTSLVFTPPPTPTGEEVAASRKFQHRMDRLRLQHEETKYFKLTNNLQKEVQDGITAKSMTYAASVGLNMIVAPLSFGCFMYFFAGGVFDYFFGEEFSARTTGGTDIKRVIVAVISGVVMLFIEMMLFVIRTHEVESHELKKKNRKKKVQPFGVYSKKGDRQAMPADKASQHVFRKRD
jgi:hypothetical protein